MHALIFWDNKNVTTLPNSPGSTPASARSSSCAMAALYGCRKQSARLGEAANPGPTELSMVARDQAQQQPRDTRKRT